MIHFKMLMCAFLSMFVPNRLLAMTLMRFVRENKISLKQTTAEDLLNKIAPDDE